MNIFPTLKTVTTNVYLFPLQNSLASADTAVSSTYRINRSNEHDPHQSSSKPSSYQSLPRHSLFQQPAIAGGGALSTSSTLGRGIGGGLSTSSTLGRASVSSANPKPPTFSAEVADSHASLIIPEEIPLHGGGLRDSGGFQENVLRVEALKDKDRIGRMGASVGSPQRESIV